MFFHYLFSYCINIAYSCCICSYVSCLIICLLANQILSVYLGTFTIVYMIKVKETVASLICFYCNCPSGKLYNSYTRVKNPSIFRGVNIAKKIIAAERKNRDRTGQFNANNINGKNIEVELIFNHNLQKMQFISNYLSVILYNY